VDNDLPTKEDRAKTAHYGCEHCHADWNDVHAGTSWRTAAGSGRAFNGVAGFHISELYSPWKKLLEIVLDS